MEEEVKKGTIRKGEDDKVDTDFLVRQARAKYALWKAHNKKLKKQYLEQADEVFNKISEGIQNGTFTYNSLENGFNNFSGVVNLDDGIDIPGRIANIWTESLNLSPQYIDPTKVQETQEVVEQPVTEEEPSPAIQEEQQVDETPKSPVYKDENEWRMAVYPRSSETNLLNYTINRKMLTSQREQFKFLQQCINKLNEKELFKMIEIGLTYPEKPVKGKNLNYIDKIVKPFVEKYKGVSKFSNSLILYTAIEIARQKNLLHQFDPSDNRYYIPLNMEGYKKRRTGLVFQISPDGKHKLIEMDRNDIPYFTNQWHDEYLKLYPSHKNGGVIKAQSGWRTHLASGIDENKVALDPKLWNGAYGEFGDRLKEWLASDSYKNLNADTFLASLNSLESDDFKDLKWTNAEGNPEFDYTNKKWAKGYAKWNQKYNDTGLNSIFGYNQDKEDLLGLTTYNRKWFLDELKKTYTRDTWLDIGDQKIQWDEENKQWIKFNSSPKTSTIETEEKLGSGTKPDFVGGKPDPYEEIDFRKASWKDKLMANWDQIIAGLRLPFALHNNEQVTKVGLKALKPVLEDAPSVDRYEEGTFDQESFANSNASDTEYKAKHSNLTSDAYLTSAQMLEGLRMGNEMRKQGFLLGNQEWKRSREASWQQEKENVQNAIQTANRNRASINMTNKERAQLITQKLRANWQSWDNFLQGIQTRIREDYKEYNTLQNSFKTQLAEKQAERWLSRAIEKADAAKDRELARQKAAGMTPDITNWRGYERYKKHIMDAQAMYEAMRYRDLGRIYNIPYKIPYTDEEFMTFLDSWID